MSQRLQLRGRQPSGSVDLEATFGAGLYNADEHSELPPEAVAASLGCGNPTAVAEFRH